MCAGLTCREWTGHHDLEMRKQRTQSCVYTHVHVHVSTGSGAHNKKERATLDTGNGTAFDQTTVPSMSIYGDRVIITK